MLPLSRPERSLSTGIRLACLRLARGLMRHKALVSSGLLTLGLLPFFALSFYNFPFWDDFGNALLVRDLGLWNAQQSVYHTWSGRYASTLLLTAGNPLAYGWLPGFRITPLLLLGGTLLALSLILRELSGRSLSRRAALRGAAFLLLLCLAGVPSIYPTFYWFSSGFVYQVGIILLLLIPSFALRALRAATGWQQALWYGLALLSTATVAGLNELALLVLGGLLLLLLLLSCRSGHRRAASCWAGLLACALAASAVALLAPGNFVRLHGPGTGTGPAATRQATTVLAFAVKNAAQFLTTPRQALLLVLTPLLLGPYFIKARQPGFRLPFKPGAAALLAGLSGCFVFFALVSPAMPPPRTLSFIWLWFYLGWLAVLWAAAPAPVPARLRSFLVRCQRPALLYTAFFLTAGLVHNAWAEWLRNAAPWQAQNEARYAAMQQAIQHGQRTATVSPFAGFVPRHISIIGETLYFNPANIAQYHNNNVTARWFGLDTVKLASPPMPGRISDDL